MDEMLEWNKFANTGKIEDYLEYKNKTKSISENFQGSVNYASQYSGLDSNREDSR